MIDIETNRPLRVNTDGIAGPYLMVPLNQLVAVQHVLQQHRLAFSVAKDAIQLDNKPVIAIIDFGRGANADQIQAVLDAA